MKPHSSAQRTLVCTAAGALCSALLAACGGGGDSGLSAGLSADNAQGYAADAVTMPVTAGNGADAATATLETGLATAAAASSSSGTQQALSATPQAGSPTGTAACPNGGTVSWSVTGGTAATQDNGQLDAGETFSVTYTACATADPGVVLDGNLTLVVNARTSTSLDLTHTATAFKITNSLGQFTLAGTWSHQRTSASTSSGGTQYTSHVSSPGYSLTSVVGSRTASYQLNSLDWTVVRTFDSTGALVARSHQGTLSLNANTPRRPAATLQITTQGSLALATDGLASQGSFVVSTANATISCTYGSGSATLTLDLGNDGTIDKTWTITRPDFDSDAG